jgi:acyl carrier protein
MSTAQKLVYEVIDTLNSDPSIETRIDKDSNFFLLDDASTIDSLTLVNLFVGIESLIEIRLGKSISIVNEDSFTSDQHPFKNIGNLTNYIQSLLDR